jgi:hypothetical protein
MAQGEDILDQADALMRRHRSFVARGETTDLPPATAADDAPGAGDIPLLTEIVEIATGPSENEGAQSAQSKLIEQTLDTWLAEAMTSRIDALLEQVGKQLLADLSDEARATLLPRLQAALEASRHKE